MNTLKNTIISGLLVIGLGALQLKAQVQPSPCQNLNCVRSLFICEDTDAPVCKKKQNYWFEFEVKNAIQILDCHMISGNGFGYELYGPMPVGLPCNQVNNWNTLLQASGTSYQFNTGFGGLGTYFLVIIPKANGETISIDFRPDRPCIEMVSLDSCESCIGSFAPIADDKKYVISAWAREHNPALSVLSFDDPNILVQFGAAGNQGPFFPSGRIIDGWQRIEGEFIVPQGATEMSISLRSQGARAYFDDVRVFPYNGSMKSYVYDPLNLRLMAELDERNYATFYEYDEEGQLTRIKKETEDGIMTIQETKQYKAQ